MQAKSKVELCIQLSGPWYPVRAQRRKVRVADEAAARQEDRRRPSTSGRVVGGTKTPGVAAKGRQIGRAHV